MPRSRSLSDCSSQLQSWLFLYHRLGFVQGVSSKTTFRTDLLKQQEKGWGEGGVWGGDMGKEASDEGMFQVWNRTKD